jgi:hypothetical protein
MNGLSTRNSRQYDVFHSLRACTTHMSRVAGTSGARGPPDGLGHAVSGHSRATRGRQRACSGACHQCNRPGCPRQYPLQVAGAGTSRDRLRQWGRHFRTQCTLGRWRRLSRLENSAFIMVLPGHPQAQRAAWAWRVCEGPVCLHRGAQEVWEPSSTEMPPWSNSTAALHTTGIQGQGLVPQCQRLRGRLPPRLSAAHGVQLPLTSNRFPSRFRDSAALRKQLEARQQQQQDIPDSASFLSESALPRCPFLFVITFSCALATVACRKLCGWHGAAASWPLRSSPSVHRRNPQAASQVRTRARHTSDV